MNHLLKQPFIQNLQSFSNDNIAVDVLRLDVIHPIVSGNKWFKLQHYLQDAISKNFSTILTFGGAYSNHIVATAFACKELKLKSIGIVRGEKSATLSSTLQQARNYGMELHFVSRELYKNKDECLKKFHIFRFDNSLRVLKSAFMQPLQLNNSNAYIIAEGGYGNLGAKGAADILSVVHTSNYTHIICACGTGTMLAGIVEAALPHQQVIGINVLKGYENIKNDVKRILATTKGFTLLNDYHFGGYAKHSTALINWMNELWQKENLPTDIVYTSKLLFAVKDLVNKNHFDLSSKVLVIHSGGLQGNSSLKQETLLWTGV